MFIIEFLIAFVTAVVFMILAFGLLRGTNYYADRGLSGFLIFFLFLTVIWAGGLWLTPVGPMAYDVYWVPFATSGLFLLLLLLALIPPCPKSGKDIGYTEAQLREVEKEDREERKVTADTASALGFFFWLLLFVLVVAIIAGYADTAV